MAQVMSYGGAGMVTGSCHLLEIEGIRILIDCGMIQGSSWEENYNPFDFDPASIDYLVITHAHNDHIGRTPKLLKEGFKGTIFTTKATWDMAFIMLLDSAALLEEEYQTQLRKAQRRGEEALVKEPLYTKAHVEALFTCKVHLLEYDTAHTVASCVSVVFHRGGHILGSAFVEFQLREEAISKTLVFSGDIGSQERLLLHPLSPLPPQTQTLFVESTYGDREHRPLKESIEELRQAICDTLAEGGNIVIPSFALERTQELLWLLHKMHTEGLLRGAKVFLDSPLAIEATKIYERYPAYLNQELGLHVSLGDDPFDFPELTLTPRKKDSLEINEVQKRAIIIAGSGMCTGGRVVHHLKQRIWNPKNAVIFVGYQVQGTLGREIVDGASYVRMYGEDIKVRAKIYTINGFSAHADRKDTLSWMASCKALQNIYLIHGEQEKMELFKAYIKEHQAKKVHIVKVKERIYV